jgi:hypothetical protein
LEQLRCVTLKEWDRLKEAPNLLIAPMLTEDDVSGILGTANVIESNDLGSNSLANMVERKGIMVLVKFGMRNCRAIDDGLVITKDNIALGTDGHTKVIEWCGD